MREEELPERGKNELVGRKKTDQRQKDIENRKQDREKRAAWEDISLMLFCMFPLFGLDAGPEGNKTQRHSYCRVSGHVCPVILWGRAARGTRARSSALFRTCQTDTNPLQQLPGDQWAHCLRKWQTAGRAEPRWPPHTHAGLLSCLCRDFSLTSIHFPLASTHTSPSNLSLNLAI